MVTSFASAINSPAIPSINREFGNTNSLLATLSVTIYLCIGLCHRVTHSCTVVRAVRQERRYQPCKHMLLPFHYRLRIGA
ncbi:major facilitator superfamily transporter [Colletotrichum asianum]